MKDVWGVTEKRAREIAAIFPGEVFLEGPAGLKVWVLVPSGKNHLTYEVRFEVYRLEASMRIFSLWHIAATLGITNGFEPSWTPEDSERLNA